MRRLTCALLLLLAACGKKEPEVPRRTPEEAKKVAVKAAGTLMRTLLERLIAALKEAPPENAVHLCNEIAQHLTAKIAKEQGVFMRRTALKIRNPKNAPDDYERAWMEKNAGNKTPAYSGESEVVGDELRFIRPLYIATACLNCHGPDVSPAVKAVLKEKYPNDQATGFKPGDFRGIVSVRVPLK